MLTFLSAGESHGRGVFALLDGLPAGVEVDRELVDADLVRRQQGYGRGGRMAIERDRVDVLSGVRGSKTLGSPVLLAVWNRDWENWQPYMDPWSIEPGRELHTPRPGHADLAGAARFHHEDLRNILERASARETAGRVAAGGLLRGFLRDLGMDCHGWVRRIGEVESDAPFDRALRDASSTFCPDEEAGRRMEQIIDRAKASGDTLGGEFCLVLEGLPAGVGTHTQWRSRLDTLVSGHLMSIPGIKAVQIGAGVEAGIIPGSACHDPILPGRPLRRSSNRAGGVEGGMSTGEPLTVRCTMKPIPTLVAGLPTVDLTSGEAVRAEYERSDCCAVPAAEVVGEAMLIIAVSTAICESFGMGSQEALREAFAAHRAYGEGL